MIGEDEGSGQRKRRFLCIDGAASWAPPRRPSWRNWNSTSISRSDRIST